MSVTPRRILVAALVVVAACPLLGVWAAYSSLRSAVAAVDDARAELVSGSGDLEPLLLDALADGDHALGVMNDPLVGGLAALSGTADSLDAARSLATNARRATSVALRTWRAIDDGSGDLFADG